MRNILIFMVLLVASLLFDLMLDIPLGVPMHEDIQSILRKVQIIDPIILWFVGILLVLAVFAMGIQKERK